MNITNLNTKILCPFAHSMTICQDYLGNIDLYKVPPAFNQRRCDSIQPLHAPWQDKQ